MNKVYFYRRNLPHIHPTTATFFITFRLANSLPTYLIEQLRLERKYRMKEAKKLWTKKLISRRKLYVERVIFMRYDKYLNKCQAGPEWLKNFMVAGIVKSKLWNYNKKRYDLISYCIMPNHVHLVINMARYARSYQIYHNGPTNKYPLTDTLRLIKGSTARLCNMYLKKSGQFWHHESYDHYIRNEDELWKIIRYMRYNPLKAGLVKNLDDWPNFFCGI